jgi:drug/metabolite transporter (DMT)-like permease
MAKTGSNYAKGLAITAIGGLALTIDIPLIRLADGDPWSILLLRSGTTFLAALAIWLLWAVLRGNPPALVPGRSGLAVASLYGAASVTFVMAVFNTSTANLVFILAFNTVFATFLSWLFLREQPRVGTLVAMVAMLAGVLIIVLDSIGRGSLVGDLFALTSSLLLASAITVTRASGKDMGFAALVAFIAPTVLGAIMVAEVGFRVEQPVWIVLNGIAVLPLSFFCLATGPKYISGPEVAMFYLLETVLAPVWVWMIFAEVPTIASLIGGMILIATLVAHSLWSLRKQAQPG